MRKVKENFFPSPLLYILLLTLRTFDVKLFVLWIKVICRDGIRVRARVPSLILRHILPFDMLWKKNVVLRLMRRRRVRWCSHAAGCGICQVDILFSFFSFFRFVSTRFSFSLWLSGRWWNCEVFALKWFVCDASRMRWWRKKKNLKQSYGAAATGM